MCIQLKNAVDLNVDLTLPHRDHLGAKSVTLNVKVLAI